MLKIFLTSHFGCIFQFLLLQTSQYSQSLEKTRTNKKTHRKTHEHSYILYFSTVDHNYCFFKHWYQEKWSENIQHRFTSQIKPLFQGKKCQSFRHKIYEFNSLDNIERPVYVDSDNIFSESIPWMWKLHSSAHPNKMSCEENRFFWVNWWTCFKMTSNHC